jgi:hypothetical protein
MKVLDLIEFGKWALTNRENPGFVCHQRNLKSVKSETANLCVIARDLQIRKETSTPLHCESATLWTSLYLGTFYQLQTLHNVEFQDD